MRKAKQLMLAAAFMFAAGAAFATRSGSDETLYRENPADPEDCITQTECTLTSGNPCTFTVYTDEGCNTIVDRKRL